VTLAIPGQTPPPVETSTEAINAAGQVSKLLAPEAIGKPELYSGYGRAHDADALETVELNSNAAIAEQLKVEIIPSEDTPTTTPLDTSQLAAAPSMVQIPAAEAVKDPPAGAQQAAEMLAAPAVEPAETKTEKNVVRKVLTAEQETAKARKVMKEKLVSQTPLPTPKKIAEAVTKVVPPKKAKASTTEEDEWSLDNFNPANLTAADLASKPEEEGVGLVDAAEPVANTKPASVKPQAEKTVAAKSSAAEADLSETEDATVDADSGNGRYTLQVIAFSRPELLESFMQKHRAMGGNLRYITVKKEGGDHYLVFYGSYTSSAQANAAKRKLPAEFAQAWARKM
jgi:septal ring-binding cell division protein DamX